MSLYDDASLIITPNAYKTSKLYSIKPTDGSGDLSVVRATTATRVNSDGLIESVGANIPRLDYSNGSCPSILVEPQRTNLALYSEQFDNAYWSKSGTTIIANDTISPDGNTTADRVTSTINGNCQIEKLFYVSNSTQYTFSVFAKKGTQHIIQLYVSNIGNIGTFDLLNGTIINGVNAKIEDYGNGWYRCSSIQTGVSIGYFVGYIIGLNSTVDSYFYIWGAQLEAGANATSYIPTVASTVTRNADVISKTGISDLIGQTEGTIVAKFSTKELNTFKRILSIKSSNNQNRIALRIINSNNLGTEVVANNLVVYNANANVGFTSNTFFKIAVKYTNTNIKLFVNGVLILNSGIVSLNFSTLLDTIVVGVSESSLISENINGEIKQAQIYKTALTDAECIALTTL